MAPDPGARGKGTTLIPTVKFLRKHRERAAPLVPERLRHYLDERILPGSWYPEDDLMQLLNVLVRLIPGDARDTWRMFGEEAAEAHSAGHYETFVRGGTHRLLGAFDALWRLLHDTGRWEIAVDGTTAEARLDDFPAGMPQYGELMVGYFRRILAKRAAPASRSASWSSTTSSRAAGGCAGRAEGPAPLDSGPPFSHPRGTSAPAPRRGASAPPGR